MQHWPTINNLLSDCSVQLWMVYPNLKFSLVSFPRSMTCLMSILSDLSGLNIPTTWAIWKWKSSTRWQLVQVCKIWRFMYRFGGLTKTNRLSLGQVSRVTWDWKPQGFKTLQRLDHFAWHWAHQWTDMLPFISLHFLQFFLSCNKPVAILRWQSLKTKHEHLTSSVLVHLEPG